MSHTILILLTFGMFFMPFCTLIFIVDNFRKCWPWTGISAIPFIVLASWLYAADSLPSVKESEIRVVPTKVTSPNGVTCKVISYINQANVTALRNLNEVFHGDVPDNVKVKVVFYRQNGYYGVTYEPDDFRKETLELDKD